LRAPRMAPTVPLPHLGDLNFIGTDKVGAHTPQSQQGWIGLAALLKVIRDQFMVLVPAAGKQTLGFGFVTVNTEDPPNYTPASIDLFNETSVYVQASILLALSSIRSQSGASPRDMIDMLLNFAEHSLRIDEESTPSSRSVDSAHYVSLLL